MHQPIGIAILIFLGQIVSGVCQPLTAQAATDALPLLGVLGADDEELPPLIGNGIAVVVEVENTSAATPIDRATIGRMVVQRISAGMPAVTTGSKAPVVFLAETDLTANSDKVVFFFRVRFQDLLIEGRRIPAMSYSYVLGSFSFGRDALIGHWFRRTSIPKTLLAPRDSRTWESQISSTIDQSLQIVLPDLMTMHPATRDQSSGPAATPGFYDGITMIIFHRQTEQSAEHPVVSAFIKSLPYPLLTDPFLASLMAPASETGRERGDIVGNYRRRVAVGAEQLMHIALQLDVAEVADPGTTKKYVLASYALQATRWRSSENGCELAMNISPPASIAISSDPAAARQQLGAMLDELLTIPAAYLRQAQ
jgi:hypothetical protein